MVSWHRVAARGALYGTILPGLFSPSTARAEEPTDLVGELVRGNVYVSPGVVWSGGRRAEDPRGFGFELSAGYYLPWRTPAVLGPSPTVGGDRHIHVGGFFRSQRYDGPRGGYGRESLGAQVGYGFLGAEVGWAHRGAFEAAPAQNGLQLAPYVSLGFVYVGAQIVLPTQEGAPGYELNAGLKLPLSAVLSAIAVVGVGASGSEGRR